jgi:hypothetical protein
MRVRIVIVLAALLVGGAVLAAQNEPRSPNDGAEDGGTPGTTLPVEEMVGRSPDDLVEEPVVAAGELPVEEMVGRSPDDVAAEPVVAASELPVEDMVGRSPDDLVAEPAGEEAARDVGAALATGRRFFLTSAGVTGADADAACPAGFHMANLFELQDVTALAYDPYVPGARAASDMGSGPVAGRHGWVRTGGDGSDANIVGQANCNAWTTAAPESFGTSVQLNSVWTAGGVSISPWQARTWSCGGLVAVWCIQD